MASAACAVLVRNAQASVLDWITWHLALGFKRVLVFDTGSTDSTQDIVRTASTSLPVELHQASHWRGTSDTIRLMVTREAVSLTATAYDWLIVLDADEYLDPGDSLSGLLNRAGNAEAIALNWCIFGSAGHKARPSGHIVATHPLRSRKSLPDNGFTRLLFKPGHRGTIAEPYRINIDPWRIVTPAGYPVQWAGKRAPVEWNEGRILHYICTSEDESADMPDHLWRHFDRNDVEDLAPRRFLQDVRSLQNTFWTKCLRNAAGRLALMAANKPLATERPEWDSQIPERRDTPALTFRRVRPTQHERLLLSPQYSPTMGRLQGWVLRNRQNQILCVNAERQTVAVSQEMTVGQVLLLAIIQDNLPNMLTLSPIDGKAFSFGNIPSPEGIAAIPIQPCEDGSFFRIPSACGIDDEEFAPISIPPSSLPELAAVPEADTSEGVSLPALCIWASRTERKPQDLQRALCLLSPAASTELHAHMPELAPFLFNRN